MNFYFVKNLCHETIYISKARKHLLEEKKIIDQKIDYDYKVKINE